MNLNSIYEIVLKQLDFLVEVSDKLIPVPTKNDVASLLIEESIGYIKEYLKEDTPFHNKAELLEDLQDLLVHKRGELPKDVLELKEVSIKTSDIYKKVDPKGFIKTIIVKERPLKVDTTIPLVIHKDTISVELPGNLKVEEYNVSYYKYPTIPSDTAVFPIKGATLNNIIDSTIKKYIRNVI